MPRGPDAKPLQYAIVEIPYAQHTIHVRQLKATIDVHIHYSLETDDGTTTVTRWLVLDIAMPVVFRPLRPLVTRSFDKENVRTMAALKAYAEANR